LSRFKMAPWDVTVKFFTWTTIALVLFIYGGVFILGGEEARRNLGVHALFLGLFFSFGACYALGPRSYLVNEKGVRIERTVGSIFIPYAQILSVEVVEQANLSRAVGNGGIFSYYGTYFDGSGTKVKVYATRFERMVQIQTIKQSYYLSPDDPESFVEAVKRHLT